MRATIYSMVNPYPRFLTEVTVPEDNLSESVQKFWKEQADIPGYHLIVIG